MFGKYSTCQNSILELRLMKYSSYGTTKAMYGCSIVKNTVLLLEGEHGIF